MARAEEAQLMKLAMVLYHYFPWGGLQRDFARVAREAVSRGHEVVALVSDWDGDPVEGVRVETLRPKGRSNHGRMAAFARLLTQHLAQQDYDRVLGFNRVPGLDVYFAADSCFAAHVASKPALVRKLPRYATYLKLEGAITASSGPHILFLNEDQRDQYRRFYDLPDTRFSMLPPGIEADRRRPDNHAQLRSQARARLGVADNETLLMFLGSGFKVKGLDRALLAFATLPDSAQLMIVGNDEAEPYLKTVAPQVRKRIQVLGPRDDVPVLMQAADLLLHPAYRESAGMVLLEATVAGLPVLTTDTCGYARYVEQAGSGEVIASPFRQDDLNATLQRMVDSLPGPWQENGLTYAQSPALYQLAQNVVNAVEKAK